MDEQKKMALRQRALELAKEPFHESPTEESDLYLVFTLGSELYAIEAAYVREVYPLKRITPVPCTPTFILGIVNLRGQILSVVDVRELLRVRDTSIPDSAKIAVLFTSDVEVAVVIDNVIGIRTFSSRDLVNDSSLPQTEGIEYVSGVTRDRIVILDAEKLLAADRMIVNEEVT